MSRFSTPISPYPPSRWEGGKKTPIRRLTKPKAGLVLTLPKRKVGWIGLLFFIFIALSACSGKTENLYLPPTRLSNAQPPTAILLTPTPAQVTPLATQPTPTPPCADSLSYIEDLTIPDGSLVAPGEGLDKRWLVENNGTCNWDQGYRLKLVAGPDLGAATEQGLYPARSGTQATIRIVFAAPAEAGAYRSAWQAYSPDGQSFGDPVFIDIQVGP